MKVKIKDGGIYRTVEIDSTEYGIYLKKGYTKVVEEEPKVVEPEPIKEVEVEEAKVEEPEEEIIIPKPKKKKKVEKS